MTFRPRVVRARSFVISATVLVLACVANPAILGSQQRSESYAQPVSQRGSIELTHIAPKGTPLGVTAVLLTGDGGWAELIKSLAEGLAAHGFAVVGMNSRAWLSSPKSPDATADAVVSAIEASRQRSPATRLILVGYSRGADMAPFVANRLPANLRAQLAGVAMLGLSVTASFEFHLIDLVRDVSRPTDLPVRPELERLRGVPMVCVVGTSERSSGCRNAPGELMRIDERKGGHHFDGDTDALVQNVLRLLETRP